MAQASFLAALMFYLGAIYQSAFYAYFHLDVFALGLSFPEFIIHSLGLLRAPVVAVATLSVLIARSPDLLLRPVVPSRLVGVAQRVSRAVAGAQAWVVLCGVGLVFAWREIQPYQWISPVVIAMGILLGQTSAADTHGRPQGLRGRAVPIFMVGICLLWATALVAVQLGTSDARRADTHLISRAAIVVYSTDRLSLTGPPAVTVEDLGKSVHFRYRYSGLRLLVERDSTYYILPVGFNHRVDAIYVLAAGDMTRIELMPGTQPR